MPKNKKTIRAIFLRTLGVLVFSFLLIFSRTGVFASGSDINGDGCVDSKDFQSVAGNFGGSSVTTDLNGDGRIDVKDVAMLMSGWGTGCSNVASCPELNTVVNKNVDASSAIQTCIGRVVSGGRVELPAGVYVVNSRVGMPVGASRKSFTITTKGKTNTSPPCSINDTTCATIFASNTFNNDGKSDYGVFAYGRAFSGSTVDHIILDGNKDGRKNSVAAGRCVNSPPAAGTNFNFDGDNFVIQNSVSKNGLCATGLGLSGNGLTVQNNIVAYNGTHNVNMMWADGITLPNDSSNTKVLNNTVMNNTDVDLIVGGGNIQVLNNTITHDTNPAHGSYGALALFDWKEAGVDPTMTADYTGSLVSGNAIDCGSSRNCGFGILVGRDPWGTYPPLSLKGLVMKNNTVVDAGMGIIVDDAISASLSNNSASWRNGKPTSVRGNVCTKTGVLVGQGNKSVSISWGNLMPTLSNWDNCILNWAL